MSKFAIKFLCTVGIVLPVQLTSMEDSHEQSCLPHAIVL